MRVALEVVEDKNTYKATLDVHMTNMHAMGLAFTLLGFLKQQEVI